MKFVTEVEKNNIYIFKDTSTELVILINNISRSAVGDIRVEVLECSSKTKSHSGILNLSTSNIGNFPLEDGHYNPSFWAVYKIGHKKDFPEYLL